MNRPSSSAEPRLDGETYVAVDVNNILVDLPHLDFTELFDYIDNIADVRRVSAFIGEIHMQRQKSEDWYKRMRQSLHKKYRGTDTTWAVRQISTLRKMGRKDSVIHSSNVDCALSTRIGLDFGRSRAEHLLVISGDGDFTRVAEELNFDDESPEVLFSVAGVRGSIHQRLRECVTGELIELDQIFPNAKKQNGNGATIKRKRNRPVSTDEGHIVPDVRSAKDKNGKRGRKRKRG